MASAAAVAGAVAGRGAGGGLRAAAVSNGSASATLPAKGSAHGHVTFMSGWAMPCTVTMAKCVQLATHWDVIIAPAQTGELL